MRRLLLILLALILLAAVAFGVWYLFFRGAPSGDPRETPGDPFGGAGGGNAEIPEVIPEVGVPMTGAGEEVAPRLFRVAEGPVAYGAVAFRIFLPAPAEFVTEDDSATSAPRLVEDTEIRFVDRASGNLYRYRVDRRELSRLTNRTLPGIQEAAWSRDGERAYLRYLADDGAGERVETYSLPADGSEGYVLQPGLSDVVVGSTTVLTVLPSGSGAIGTRATLAGASPTTVFSTQLSTLRFAAAGAGFAATTRASANLPGHSYFVSPNGEFTRLLGPLRGLTVLPSPSGGRYLFGSVGGGTLRLDLLSVNPPGVTALPVSTIADKCAWMPDETRVYCAVPRAVSGTWPDDWYQGQVSPSDRIWEIDLSSRVASLVFDPMLLAEEEVDAVALTIDDGGDVLVFTNKKDGSLWFYDL